MVSFNLKKFGFRVAVITITYLLIKLTIDHQEEDTFFDATGIFYYLSAFFLFMFTWETNDWLLKREQLKHVNKSLDLSTNLRVMILNMLLLLPVIALTYYLAIYHFDSLCRIITDDKGLRFRIDFFRAALLGFAVIIFNLLYHSVKQKNDIEKQRDALQLELTNSKYKSLKQQISPHFLFNSLNTLTSLMYEDRDLASDFVTRLAACYRYILDNREEDLVSLDKELQFLDAFIFMMKVRHENAIYINQNIDIKADHVFIPTLSLQMLVENALKHNYYSKEQPITIDISIRDQRLIVKNNIKKRKDSETSTQLGLANIKKRYAFYTNKDVIVDNDNHLFKVSMPILTKNNIISKDLTVA